MIVAKLGTPRRKTAMCSEVERITNEVMDRHDFGRLGEHLGRAHSLQMDGDPRTGIDPNFTNSGYMDLEKPSRDGRH
jgi:hypothetical protein